MKPKLKLILLTMVIIASGFCWYNYQFFLQNDKYGKVTGVADMNTKRSVHTATLLPDGRVFLAGGILKVEGIEENNTSTEYFNPSKNSFATGPSMAEKRAGHTATLLKNGKILITGGFNETGFLNSASLLNTSSNTFEAVGSTLSEPRAAHTATLLQDGRVLLIGGVNGSAKANQWIDVYNPATNLIERLCKLRISRTGHTSTLLNNGKVLIAGGSENWRSNVLSSCEIFDPVTNSITQTTLLNVPRNKHAAVLLQDGNVLIIAGSDDAAEIGGRYSTCELYNPETNSFKLLKEKLTDSRFKITNAADIRPDGKVIIAGDGKYTEIFDIVSKDFYTPRGSLGNSWMYPTVTTLQNGNVLVCGGYDGNMQPTNKAWIYKSK